VAYELKVFTRAAFPLRLLSGQDILQLGDQRVIVLNADALGAIAAPF
jgi:hypothetical protein